MTGDGRAVAVVRRVWDAYLAGDVDGALEHFAADAVWESPGDVAGPTAFRGRDEIRLVLDTADRFSLRRVSLTDVTDMGSFVLAHGVVYAEQGDEVIVDRVTTWRFYLSGERIVRVATERL